MQVKEAVALRVCCEAEGVNLNGKQKQENIQDVKDNLFFHI
jgi:hypothetical protein